MKGRKQSPQWTPNSPHDKRRSLNQWRTRQRVASSQPVRRSPSPPPSPPAPRAPPPRQNVVVNVSDGRFPAHDPYFHPRLPRYHPFHFGPRHGEDLPRRVFGVPPPPPMGMTREERDRVWGIANGLRDARFRVRTQEVMMERAL
uniref:protein phosphatase 1 regulatory subunit 37-like n=1 Tax=Erigeron canadensis TaxID=72917 RepID=UPI001CB9441D|nr:protein phosphatase 1 regulatory subunit 37-like [Erigeron canadensis]